MKIAVLLHLFYIDMWDEIKSKLENITQDYKLYVNLVDGFYDDKILDEIKKYKSDVIINISENKGVAIGGFLNLIKKVDKVDLLLLLHTKKSIGLPNKPSDMVKVYGLESAIKRGIEWHNKIVDGVLKNKTQVKEILERFENDEMCAMLGYANKENYIGPNEPLLKEMLKIFNLNENVYGSNFVDGAMFWVKFDIIKKYFTDEIIDTVLDMTPSGYLNEPSINHVIERIFGYIIKNENKKIVVI